MEPKKTPAYPRLGSPTSQASGLRNEPLPERVQRERGLELAAFLRACRQRLDPAALGLSERRRRTPGLRREEVAARAGMSLDWYVRLEQGRDVHPTFSSVDRLADALRLEGHERHHLHVLAETIHAEPLPDVSLEPERLQTLIDHLDPAPAFIINPRWDVLAENRGARAVFGDYRRGTELERNLLWQFFVAPIFTEHLDDWSRHAEIFVRQYRALYARSAFAPDFRKLILALQKVAPAFFDLWEGVDVSARDDGFKAIEHPILGRLEFDYVLLRSVGAAALEVVAFLPRAGTPTAQQIEVGVHGLDPSNSPKVKVC